HAELGVRAADEDGRQPRDHDPEDHHRDEQLDDRDAPLFRRQSPEPADDHCNPGARRFGVGAYGDTSSASPVGLYRWLRARVSVISGAPVSTSLVPGLGDWPTTVFAEN